MIDWLAHHGSLIVTPLFFALFVGFGFWAYWPSNKKKLQSYGQIPLREGNDGE